MAGEEIREAIQQAGERSLEPLGGLPGRSRNQVPGIVRIDPGEFGGPIRSHVEFVLEHTEAQAVGSDPGGGSVAAVLNNGRVRIGRISLRKRLEDLIPGVVGKTLVAGGYINRVVPGLDIPDRKLLGDRT